MKLDIGCGRTPESGYTGVDVAPEVHPDICAPMWQIPLPEYSVEAIYTSHALEHIGKYQIIPTLKEWYRLLKAGGTVEIRVPDLEWCCKNWLEHKTNDWHMDALFGNQEHEGEFHKTGFTYEIMLKYLNEVGFILEEFEVIWSHNQNTLRFIARKPWDVV